MHRKWIAFIGIAVLLSGCSSGGQVASQHDDTAAYTWNTDAEMYSYGQTQDDPAKSRERTEGQYAPIGENHPSENQTMEFEDDYSSILFKTNTNSIEAEDGTTLLYESYDSADFYASDPELNEWGRSVIGDIEQEYHQNSAQLLESAEVHYRDFRETFYSYSNYLNIGTARHDGKVMSILTVNSMHSGGAHPITMQYAYNLDVDKQKYLTLEDIILPSGTEKMRELVLEGLKKDFAQLGTGSLYDDFELTIAELMEYGSMTPNWYFSGNALVIFFNQYEIAPYAAGVIKVEIPYENLKGILEEAYFPQPYSGRNSDLIVRDDSGEYQTTSVYLGDGDRVLVGTNDVVYQVQLSEINWLDNTPVYRRMILTMNELRKDDAIEIVGLTQQEGLSYALEFRNGAGEHKVYYIHPDGLSAEPKQMG